MPRRAVFPGSFDPLTIAHVAVAEATVAQLDVEVVDLVISEVALAKEHRRARPAAERAEAITRVTGDRPWLRSRTTAAQLLVDIAEGYDVLVIGADKWHQLVDPVFYGGSEAARDDALLRLPRLAVAPRAGIELPDTRDVVVLDLPDELGHVSSTAVRAGRHDWRAGEP